MTQWSYGIDLAIELDSCWCHHHRLRCRIFDSIL